jgi:peroxiredoxin
MCHLQELYETYRNKGLMVLGVNTSDTKKVAAALLQENGVNFPNIVDHTDEATQAMRKYETLLGMGAVPMTHAIDRQGKVVEAWYSYQEGKAEKVVRKLMGMK